MERPEVVERRLLERVEDRKREMERERDDGDDCLLSPWRILFFIYKIR